MFTGIVAAVGRIESIRPIETQAQAQAQAQAQTQPGTDADAGVRLTVNAGTLGLDDVQLGDSIAIQGACMTVIEKSATTFDVDVSRESLNRTAGLETTGEVNLEKALRANDRLGGHIVSGHVDGLGTVTRFAPVGESHELRILAPAAIGRYLAYKGSVTVNGVSLTVNSVEDRANGCEFSINLIPHTVEVTTLKHLAAGTKVNLEIDLIARYVERMLSSGKTAGL
ncbi:MAG TPA: riboflavin synthase [Paraburkholderia sp.]|uniref:riboflavin synthase n=1 Tax=Paraburkholderia sp. TaxID=1926495 RepID=UPI002C9D7127|nr:riboflavin synthase [Paraburkholderia sp.]HTR08637.1 riboflavin synthase [Paraburkholderia sp.]